MRHLSALLTRIAFASFLLGCEIIGVEIVESAKPIHTHPFKGPVAFMLGNEGQGLSQRQINACDSFVYISQYGAGTASLNVAVAASIVLHHFALWAGYEERSRSGFKFDVAERPQRVAPRGMVPLSAEEVAALQAQRAAQKAGSEAGDAGVGLDFSEEGLPEFALSTG